MLHRTSNVYSGGSLLISQTEAACPIFPWFSSVPQGECMVVTSNST